MSTRAVITGLFPHLPPGARELAPFDVKRTNTFKPPLGAAAAAAVERLFRPRRARGG